MYPSPALHWLRILKNSSLAFCLALLHQKIALLSPGRAARQPTGQHRLIDSALSHTDHHGDLVYFRRLEYLTVEKQQGTCRQEPGATQSVLQKRISPCSSSLYSICPHFSLCGLQLRLTKPQLQHVLRLADALMVSEARHKTMAGLSRLLVDAPDPSHGADTLRMSPWTAEDLRAPMRHCIVTDLVALAGLSQRLPQPRSAWPVTRRWA